ncbi:SCO family protein [Massilia sp. RP-1-19]|uniref:SCO family protein n=1 Tax=Massilia polaris TaxID=2728846 RepID=A0A848HPB5_9BURK|nr:SCO family protein [Massilia polaris]NML61093.1 SCO family protein [Massilia polaris]
MFKSILVLAACLLCAAAGAAPIAGLKSGLFEPPRVAPVIGLQGSDGSAFDLAKYRGKVVVLEFGYTHCTEVCPVSLYALAQARKLLGADAANLQVVFITVDTERDSVARLHDYLAQFDPGFVGVTGSAGQVDAVLKAYGIVAAKRMMGGSKTDYMMSHSSYLYFVDTRGMLRAMMPFGRPAAEIAHDVQLLLRN